MNNLVANIIKKKSNIQNPKISLFKIFLKKIFTKEKKKEKKYISRAIRICNIRKTEEKQAPKCLYRQ